jgi:uncharacterized caspase-like protein
VALLCGFAICANAQQVHVLIVTGLSGEPQYRPVFEAESALLAENAKSKWGVQDSSLIVLGEDAAFDARHTRGVATKENVGKAFLELAHRVSPGDVIFVFLNGHGGGEGPQSRVNLPGPDPTAAEYADWLAGFAKERVVFVNAASGSGDFVPVLSAPNRLVVSATKTGLERNETVFAKHFVRGIAGGDADADKDGRISVWEIFDYTKKEVARAYENEKKLLTEHAVLSDTSLARSIAFGGIAASSDPRIRALVAERSQLETDVAALRARKATMDSTAYTAALEKLVLAIAEKTAAIRAAGGGKP